MREKLTTGPCPYCGTQMVNCGAPIWEDYCPNETCTGERDAMFARVREAHEARRQREIIAAAAPDLYATLVSTRAALMQADYQQGLLTVIDNIDAALAKARGEP